MQKYLQITFVLLAFLGITGCQGFPYKAPIQQGNVITPSMVAKLKAGMSAEHVRYVLGEPVLVPTFHPQRWEYIYTLQPSRGQYKRRLVTVYFNNGVMEKVITETAKK
jgi:outer membrane protein assembly factor BamE